VCVFLGEKDVSYWADIFWAKKMYQPRSSVDMFVSIDVSQMNDFVSIISFCMKYIILYQMIVLDTDRLKISTFSSRRALRPQA